MNRSILATLVIALLLVILVGLYGCLRPEPSPTPLEPIEEITEAQETTQEKNEPVSPGPNEPETLPPTGGPR